MKNNNVLMEGVVRTAYKLPYTYPPSESVELEYELDKKDHCEVFDTSFDELTGTVLKTLSHVVTTGWCHIELPTYHGLKPGDKLQIIKI